MEQQLALLQQLIDASVKGGLFQNAESVLAVQTAMNQVREKLSNAPQLVAR